MHYSRIPHEYWKHRLQMVKAMGLNTVATYIFWNHHEVAPEVWDFTSGNRNLREFIKMTADEGLMVILRHNEIIIFEQQNDVIQTSISSLALWILDELKNK